MRKSAFVAAAISAIAAVSLISAAAPASAAVIVITHQKAVNGNVTPGDTPGYPVTLSRPGAYRLDNQLLVPPNRNGIEVTSFQVDLDLGGNRIFGWNRNSTQRLANIGIVNNIGVGTIRNGYITGFKVAGLKLDGDQVVVRDMIVENNQIGIDSSLGSLTRVINSSININSGNGISCEFDCHIEGNSISRNGFRGVYLKSGTVLGNTILGNAFMGIYDFDGFADTGFGNNTLAHNNKGSTQVDNVVPLQPNACIPTPC
jgi:hypothetical protein